MKPKVNKSRRVKKMMSPEEMTLLSNISSIVQELEQMGAGGAVGGEEIAMMQEDPIMDKPNEDEEVSKGLETTPSESATASDDTEERMEEPLPELTSENLSEVEKAFNVILRQLRGKTVKKSQPQSPLSQALNKIVEVQKASQTQINELTTAFSHVLEGLGVAEQLKIEKSRARTPEKVTKTQTEELLAALAQLTGVKKSETASTSSRVDQSKQVRKSLEDIRVLNGLIGPK